MEIGSRVGPYEIRELIGEGGMASVFKVWHTGLHRFEALKVPHRQITPGAGTDFVARLLNEARIAAQLHHPHIVGIYSVSDADSEVSFFSMELVVGYDLADLLERRTQLSLQEALPILRQVAEALDCAHLHGVVHRDIKPDNILLQEVSEPGGWVAKVVDFGISRAAEEESGTKLTKSGLIVGTPEYMSPEQAGSGEVVDYRTDIYSLGIVAYEMLCGDVPFTAGEGVSRMSILMSHVRDMPHPPAERIPKLPIAANNAILKALAKRPDERFTTCAEFMRALSGSVTVTPPAMAPVSKSQMSGAPVVAGGGTNANSFAPRRNSMWIVLSLLCLAFLGLIGWAYFRDNTDKDVGTWYNSKPAPPLPVPEDDAMANNSVANNAVSDDTRQIIKTAPTIIPKPVRKVVPAPKATVALRVARVVRTRPIAFARQVVRTSLLPVGQRKVASKGRNGTRRITLQITYRGKTEVARKIVEQRVLVAPIAQRELVGVRVQAASRPVVERRPPTRPVLRRRVVRSRPKVRRPIVRRPPVRRNSGVIREAPLPR